MWFNSIKFCRPNGSKPSRGRFQMMPIGTPRVPYRTPGEGTWQWVDLWNALVSHDRERSQIPFWVYLHIWFISYIYLTKLVGSFLLQYRERVIFIGQHIDEEFSNQILATMLYLDSIDSSKRLYLYINGPGGDVCSLFTMKLASFFYFRI